jgi:hypothetical protein
MNGQKAKALRKLAHYSVTADRPELPKGGWITIFATMSAISRPEYQRGIGTCVLPKDHPRHKYQFLKKRYAGVPLAHTLKRMHRSTALVTELDNRISEGRV